MKKVFIASLLAATLVPAFAQAADGTLNFTGSVIANTCQPTAGAGTTQTVTMSPVQTGSLSTAGDHALGAAFNVQLANCGATSKNVRLEFTNATGVDATTGRMTNTGTAANVQVALRASGTATTDLMLGSANAITPNVTSDTSGNATIPLWAFYVANGGAAGAGSVVSSVQFNIGYP